VRKTLAHYYPPTTEEFKKLWEYGAIVLDANVLLDLYRYSEASSNEFAAVLRSLSERLWIPHQVALEFHRNRLHVIDEQLAAFDLLVKKLEKARNSLEGEMSAFNKNESLNIAALNARSKEMSAELIGMVIAAKSAHPRVASSLDDDATAVLVTELFEGRVGEPFDENGLKEVYEDGAKRYKTEVPPGYMDSGKPDPDKYGDLVLWKQVLQFASDSEKDVLFITGDSKEDWWRREGGKTIGPRPELVLEFRTHSGRQVHFYAPKQFLQRAQEYLNAEISQSTFDEIDNLSAQQEADRVHDIVDARLELEGVRARIRETSTRLSLLDSPRMGAVASATRMANLEEEFTRLERSKTRWADAYRVAADPDEQQDVTDRLLSLQVEIDEVVEAHIDEREHQTSIAGKQQDMIHLQHELSELRSEQEMWLHRIQSDDREERSK
jgi:hypothetical protein